VTYYVPIPVNTRTPNIIALFYINRKQLNQIFSAITAKATQKLQPASGTCSNEFTLISQTIDRIQEEKERLSNEVRMHNNLVIERMVLSLFIYHYAADSHRKIIDELHTSIIRVAADIIGTDGYCYGAIIPSNANVALLFNMDYRETEANSRIKDMMEKIQRLYQEKLHVSLFISISKPFASRLGIREAYQEAVAGLDYRFLLGNGHIVFAQGPNVPPSVDWYIEGKETDLITAVNSQDAELVLEISQSARF
jgi:uncharacterized protein (UPF0335 family)